MLKQVVMIRILVKTNIMLGVLFPKKKENFKFFRRSFEKKLNLFLSRYI